MKLKQFLALIFGILLLCLPVTVFAAEVLQVRNSSLLQIGDRNRSDHVKLAGIDVNPSNEAEAVKLLKNKLRG